MIQRMLPASLYSRCFFMKRQLMKRLGGEWLEVTETLFPAYVFLETIQEKEVFYRLKRIPEFTKLLGDGKGAFIPLEADEEAFFKKLCGGGPGDLVRNTTVYLDRDREIRRLEGPLEQFRERIKQINLRKRYVILDVTLCGREKTALLGIRLEKDP